MANILVLIPINPKLNPELIKRCKFLVDKLKIANPNHNLEIIYDSRGPGKNTESFTKFVLDMAEIRQELVDEYLKPQHDYVFWIDADLVSYPPNLISELIKRNPDGISAPIVLYEGHKNKFYDLTGFVQEDRWCEPYPPYFSQPGPIYDLEGVGCIYLIPADIYRKGAKHQLTFGFTEHLSVCHAAKKMGKNVIAYQDLVAVHAFSPFWEFSSRDNIIIKKIKKWRAQFKIFDLLQQTDVDSFNNVIFVFNYNQNYLDKIRKTFYVARYFPKYLICYPHLFWKFIGLIIFWGPISALQTAFDFLQLNAKTAIDYKLSCESKNESGLYDDLVKNKFDDVKIKSLKQDLEYLKHKPKISIFIPIYDIEINILELALNSVKKQVYYNWELCLANGSQKKEITKFLVDYSKEDSRIKLINLPTNKGISGNSNEALRLATGEYVGLMDHDDELTPDALLEVAKLINNSPEADLIYSDHDKIDLGGKYFRPFFKPNWSPELLLSICYFGHLVVIRKSLIEQMGGFRPDFDGSQDHDLFLRITELTDKIFHIPEILYHWRMTQNSVASDINIKPYCHDSVHNVLEETLKRRKISAELIAFGPGQPVYIKYHINPKTFVSIIIPTKDQHILLKRCVESIISKTDFTNYEIIIVDNDSREKGTKKLFKYFKNLSEKIKIVDYPYKFNYSEINNFAVTKAKGDILLFLNDDTEVINPDWLSSMAGQAEQKKIGAVGAKLLYFDNTIQHAGVVSGVSECPWPLHIFNSQPENSTYFNLANSVNNYSAVTGACLMMRREVFEEIGGFDEDYEVEYSDIDLCFKTRAKGYRIVYVPQAKLYHLESASRGSLRYPLDLEKFKNKWNAFIEQGDPYYSRQSFLNITSKVPTLSLCTFVKNEEKAISGMIESVREIVDEIVVVDTGSTDKTKDIVRPLCDKLIEKEFTNFGDIRTFTLKQASCDWILMLDADERILKEDLHKILSLIRQNIYDAWSLPRHQWDNLDNAPNGSHMAQAEEKVYPDWQTRLFKNSPNIRYVNYVHETLIGYKKRGVNGGSHIQHYHNCFKNPEQIKFRHNFYEKLVLAEKNKKYE